MWLGIARFLLNSQNRTVQQVPRGPMSAADGSPPGSHDHHVDVWHARLLGSRHRLDGWANGRADRLTPDNHEVARSAQARAELAAERVADLRRVDVLLREARKKLVVAVHASGAGCAV